MRANLWLCVCVLLFVGGGDAAWANSGVEPNVLSLPQGPGSLGGVGENVRANLNMGLMSYPVTIDIPRGRGDATPSVGVSYSSSSGASSVMGIGWGFSAGGSVERMTVRGLPTYTNADLFMGGGELVKVPNSPFFRSRYEGGFARYRWIQNDPNDQRGYWVAEMPNGSKMYYGADSKGNVVLDAQVYGLKGTFRWELVTEVDRHGNRVEYTYFKEGTQTYLDTIEWVHDDQGKALYSVRFAYEDRPDHISDGKPGFDLKTTKRLKEIQITSNGQRFRSYRFSFEDATGLSRLNHVEQFGRDPAKKYPVEFRMTYSDATFSQENSRMVQMSTSLGVDFKTGNIDFLDINGDGLPDVVDTTRAKHVFFMNELTLTPDMKQDTHDFPRNKVVENPNETSAPLSNPSVQMLDVNGDGFTDLVDAVNKKMYINKGKGQWEDQSATLQFFPVDGKDPNMRFFDYNGDKAIDVLSSDGNQTTYWVSDGKGNWTVEAGNVNIGLGFQKDSLKLIDINGDGLQDIVHITRSAMRYRKYLGYGEWTEWITVKLQGDDLIRYELSTKAQFNDMNGDGMADMVLFSGNSIVYFVNRNGEEFEKGQPLQSFKGIDIPDSSKVSVRIADINGNGSRDIVWIDSSGKVTYLELFSKRPNLMTAISNGIGQRINVAYGSSVYFFLRDQVCDPQKDAACDGPWQNKMPMAFTVVTKITTWASRESDPAAQANPKPEEKPSVQRIYYHNGFYDGNEKKFRGFRKVEDIQVGDEDVSTKKDTIVFDVGDKDPYFHGKMLESVTQDMTGKTYRRVVMNWKDCGTPAGVDAGLDPPVRFICQASSQMTHIEGISDESKYKTTRSESTYDAYGNVILSRNLGDVAVEGDEAITKTTYITPQDPRSPDAIWILRAVQKLERCSKESGPCAESNYYYDGEDFKGLPAGQLTKGDLSRMTILRDLGGELVEGRLRKFDAYGNVIEKRTVLGQRRVIEWDPVYHRFPTKETIFLKEGELTASTEWDYNYSKIISATDFNGHTTRYTYDVFGRILSGFQPGDPQDKPSQQYEYEMRAPISRIITRQRTKKGGEQDRVQIQCFDGLGRKFAVHTRLASGRFRVTGHVSTNQRGQMFQSWGAYEAGEQCAFEPPEALKKEPTVVLYDALNRVLKRTFPDGSFERFEYKPFRNIFYDEEDVKESSPHFNTPKIQISDGLGRVIEVQEMIKPGEVRKMKYSYTNLNIKHEDLVDVVTYPDGKTKKHTYNLLGFLTKVEDPDRSTTEFTYDDNGNILERKDARGKVTVHTFDVHGRVLTRQEKDKPETLITYLYDKPAPELPDATNLKGRLARVTYPGGMTLSSFTERGEETRTLTKLLGVDFAINRTFNNVGDTLSETYPDGRTLSYVYDDAGRLVKMDGFVDSITYTPRGPIEKRVFTNGVETSFQVDKRGRIKEIKVSTQPGFQYGLTFDAVGNVTETSETYGDQTLSNTYQYDSLYRLTKADLRGGQETLDYTLDAQSNMLSKVSSLGKQSIAHIGDYALDSQRLSVATKAGDRALAYDKAGCMTSRGKDGFVWDYAGRLKSAERDGKEVGRYWYDHENRRTIKMERGRLSLYPTNDFRIQGGEASIYVGQSSSVIALWSSPAMMAKLYDDVAPATGEGDLKPEPDGKISAGDAWLYHAAKQDLVKVPLKERPVKVDLTRSMLEASAASLLSEGKERKLFVHSDHLGSVRVVSDMSGKAIEYKRYTPYGAMEEHQGASSVPIGFQGKEFERATRTYYFGARYLEPRLARWLTPDPAFARRSALLDEWNGYASVSNNPLRYRDTDGFFSKDSPLWWVVASSTVVAAYRIGAAIRGGIQSRNMGKTRGKKTTYSKAAFVASNLMGASLNVVVAGLAASDMNGAANITSAVIGAISAIKTGVDIYFTNHQHNQIRVHNSDSYSKGRHRRGVIGRTVSMVAGAGRAAMVAASHYEDNKSLSALMNISAIALSVISGIASTQASQSFRPRPASGGPGFSIGGVTLTTDNAPVGASMKLARARGAADPDADTSFHNSLARTKKSSSIKKARKRFTSKK